MKRLWRLLFGRDTLRPQFTERDWTRQDHRPLDGTRLHYPGDKCENDR